MPSVGLGLWKLAKSEAANTVREAIRLGYRHLDSAADYGNEQEVGEGIHAALREGLCRREELWVTSKLWNTYHRPEHVQAACERCLQDLQLDYLDLFLVHFPIALKYVDFDTRYPPEWIHDPLAAEPVMERDRVPLSDTWAAMEALVDKGLVREIGVCNYNTALLHDLTNYARRPPAMLQVESHPYLTQPALMKTAQYYGLPVTAFSPLGALSYVPLDMASAGESILLEAVVQAAARRLGKTPAQVVLRWNLQRGNAVVVKSSKLERLEENIAVHDFTLADDEMAAITALNRNRRFNDPADFCASAFNTFHAIYD